MAAPFRDPRSLAASALAAVVARVLAVLAVQAAIAVLDRGHGQAPARARPAHEPCGGARRAQGAGRRSPDQGPASGGCGQRARRRMLAAVPKATVVITNPTHYAVALSYDRAKSGAPAVVAKGVDSMAERIREVAHRERGAAGRQPAARARAVSAGSWKPTFRRALQGGGGDHRLCLAPAWPCRALLRAAVG